MAAGTMWNAPNYVGELFLVGASKTPFLNMIGGLQGTQIKTVGAFEFSLAQPYSLNAASQPDISESGSLTAPTAETYARGVDKNTCQIYQSQVSISYAKQSASGQVSVDEIASLSYGHVDINDDQPVGTEKDFQIATHMRQIALDCDYTFLQGSYQQATEAGVAAKTRGIIEGATSNLVNAASSSLSKSLIDSLLRSMAAAGSEFLNPVIFVNALQKQRLTDIYSYAPEDRNVGGTNIKQIETDFAVLGVVWAPNMPTTGLLIADVPFCSPVFLPVPDKGVLFYEELSKSGASENGQIYGQIGLDYGPEEMHGYIQNLAV